MVLVERLAKALDEVRHHQSCQCPRAVRGADHLDDIFEHGRRSQQAPRAGARHPPVLGMLARCVMECRKIFVEAETGLQLCGDETNLFSLERTMRDDPYVHRACRATHRCEEDGAIEQVEHAGKLFSFGVV